MKAVEIYARVRHAVLIEGISERVAADRFGINARTVSKMLKFSVPPGYVRTKPPFRPKLDAFVGVIDAILAVRDRSVSRCRGIGRSEMKQGERIAAAIAGARYELMPGVAHLAPREAPSAFASLLKSFLGPLRTPASFSRSVVGWCWGEVVAVYIDKLLLNDGVYQTAQAHPIMRAGGLNDYVQVLAENVFQIVRLAGAASTEHHGTQTTIPVGKPVEG